MGPAIECKARWWTGALWLLVFGLILGMDPTPSVAASQNPELVPTSTDEAQVVTVQVTGTVVNLRVGPGLHHAVMAQVQQGEELQVTGRSGDRWDQQWLQVTLDGESRWIYADLTDIDADVQR